MNTIWLKIAGAAVVAFLIVIAIGMFTSNGSNEPEQPKSPEESQDTFYDVAREDRERYLAEPEPVETPIEEPDSEIQATEPIQEIPEQQSAPPQIQPAPEPPKPTEIIIYVKPLGDIEKIEAERLYNVAVPGRSIGRLPMTGFKLMVDNCRQIIRRWPESYYAYQCKRLFAEMPERYQTRYKITEEELDTSSFDKPKAGTVPYKVTIE
jgi:hypothetical protein